MTRTPVEQAADRLAATYYRTMPGWMRWLDRWLRWFEGWRRHPYIVLFWKRPGK